MTHQKLLDLKSRLESYRNSLNETVSDDRQCIQLQIDGHFKIRQLIIQKDLTKAEIEEQIPQLLSQAIDLIAEKIRKKLEELQAAQN